MKAWPTILLAILAGCTMGPDYRRPETQAIEGFRETPEPWKRSGAKARPLATRSTKAVSSVSARS